MQCLKVMLPIEPRLKPLGATIIHYSDSETKAKFTRCHSFSGYVPYFLSDEPNEPIDCGPSPVTPPSNCSNRGGATPETDVGEASPRPPVWPDTDEEGDGPCPRSDQASSESGESEGKNRLNSGLAAKSHAFCEGKHIQILCGLVWRSGKNQGLICKPA